MTCSSCTGAIENHIKSLNGALEINISLLTNRAVIKHDLKILGARQIISEIEDLGFEAQLVPSTETVDIREIVKSEVDKYRKKVISCTILYVPIAFFIWIVPYVDYLQSLMTYLPIVNGCTLYIFILLFLSSIVQFYMGNHFYKSAFKSLKHKSANMDVLIVVSTTSAWFYGVVLIFVGYSINERNSPNYAMLIHSHVHNWETSAILIYIVIIGKYIESYSKMKTVDQLSDLASLKVSKANLVQESDQ